MNTIRKKRTPGPVYTSPNQLTLDYLQTTFDQKLLKTNGGVVLAELIPRDEICELYLKHVGITETGRTALIPRLVIGSMLD